jgi:hypothetical protein
VYEYEAVYEYPKISVRYYSANNQYAETRYIEPKFVPIQEISFKWLDGFEKYFDDIVLKWSAVEAIDDFNARTMAKEIVKYLSEYGGESGLSAVYFMTAQPTVNIDYMYGLFKSSGASIESSTFRYLQGTDRQDDFVYFADLTDLYVSGIHYDLRVNFDTPIDVVTNNAVHIWDKTKSFVLGVDIWKVLAVSGGVLIVILLFIMILKAACKKK